MDEALKQLERRLYSPWPLTGRERTIYALVMVALCSGALASHITGSWDWLARFGSLVVVIGIYFAWLDLSGTVSEVRKWQRAQVDVLLSKLKQRPRGGLLEADTIMREEEISDSASQIDRVLVLLGKRIKAVEAFTIALGTVISGFGSLLAGG